MQWIDVSAPMEPELAVWPGDPEFELKVERRVCEGASCNVSSINISLHTGTHIDSPWHFKDDGKRTHEIDSALYFGDAEVRDTRGCAFIGAQELGSAPLPERVLLRTDNSDRPIRAPFHEGFVGLNPDGAQRLVDEGVRVVGIDYLSIEPFGRKAHETHHILLENEVLIVEGLRLGAIDPGTYAFTVLPMPVVGADGAPARAFIGMPAS